MIDLTAMERTIYEAFRHFYHLDHSNAAFHCADVRYSPITFRLAEQMSVLRGDIGKDVYSDVWGVLLDKGVYEEDRGR